MSFAYEELSEDGTVRQTLIRDAEKLWWNGNPENSFHWPGAVGSILDLLIPGLNPDGDNGFKRFSNSRIVGTENISGTPCFELFLQGRGGEYERLWIGINDSLVRRYSHYAVTSEMEGRLDRQPDAKASFHQFVVDTGFEDVLETETFEPVVNAPVPKERFVPVKRAKVGLGIQLAPLDPTGVKIIRVLSDSPAAKNGLQPGDVIQAVNGLQVSSPADVVKAVASLAQGTELTLDIARNEETLHVRITTDRFNWP